MRLAVSFLCGALFGLGLMIAGMTDTVRVQGFLDVLGAWDPTLAFVLGGAMVPMALAWRIAAGRRRALLGGALPGHPSARVEAPLLLGGALFGTGWALVGLCPGPAMASLSYGGGPGIVFLLAMIAGMLLHRRTGRLAGEAA